MLRSCDWRLLNQRRELLLLLLLPTSAAARSSCRWWRRLPRRSLVSCRHGCHGGRVVREVLVLQDVGELLGEQVHGGPVRRGRRGRHHPVRVVIAQVVPVHAAAVVRRQLLAAVPLSFGVPAGTSVAVDLQLDAVLAGVVAGRPGRRPAGHLQVLHHGVPPLRLLLALALQLAHDLVLHPDLRRRLVVQRVLGVQVPEELGQVGERHIAARPLAHAVSEQRVRLRGGRRNGLLWRGWRLAATELGQVMVVRFVGVALVVLGQGGRLPAAAALGLRAGQLPAAIAVRRRLQWRGTPRGQ